MRRALLLALVLASCRCAPSREAPREIAADLRAIVEDEGALTILERHGEGWTAAGTLPGSARAVRLSPNGRHLAWVEDRTERPAPWTEGFLALQPGAPVSLGKMGFREHEAFGLAVDDAGRTLFLAPQGLVTRGAAGALEKGAEPVCGPGGCAWVDGRCVSSPVALAKAVCGDALRPLDVRAGRLLARTNAELVLADVGGEKRLPLTDVLDARLGPGDAWLVVRRVQDSGRVSDQLLYGKVAQPPQELLRAPVLLNARFLPDGRIVAVRAEGDAMQNLLAHAPDEFGGEALAGDAIEIEPLRPLVRPVAGLEHRHVRIVAPLLGL